MAPMARPIAIARPGRDWARRARAAHATAREAAGPLALAIPKRAALAVDYVARQERTKD